jgi:shikimate kinase
VKADKVYLVGFMGAGKTTLARKLAERLHWDVEDIDDRIERRERRDIPSIFRQDGEAYFRAVEREELLALLPRRGVVIATGGGTFVDPANRALMRRDGAVIWLDAPLSRLLDRIPRDGRRPLAADRVELERLYNERLTAYAEAHLRLDTGRDPVDAAVEQAADWLGG